MAAIGFVAQCRQYRLEVVRGQVEDLALSAKLQAIGFAQCAPKLLSEDAAACPAVGVERVLEGFAIDDEIKALSVFRAIGLTVYRGAGRNITVVIGWAGNHQFVAIAVIDGIFAGAHCPTSGPGIRSGSSRVNCEAAQRCHQEGFRINGIFLIE